MSKIRRASALIPTPKAFVRSVLSKVALPCGALWTKRPGVVTPYWSHALLDYVMVCRLHALSLDANAHVYMQNAVGWNMLYVRYTHSLHKSIRTRALRKLERETKKQ